MFLFVSFCVDVDVVLEGVFRSFLVEVTFDLGVEMAWWFVIVFVFVLILKDFVFIILL